MFGYIQIFNFQYIYDPFLYIFTKVERNRRRVKLQQRGNINNLIGVRKGGCK